MDTLKIIRPDDWHLHLRDNQALETTVPAAARCFGRGIIMPNLNPPVTHVEMAHQYRNRILKHRPANSDWQPLMVLYLTDNTSPNEIYAAAESGLSMVANIILPVLLRTLIRESQILIK